MPSPTQKTVLVTGASTGFGRDAAETLAREGHTVFATMRHVNSKNKTAAEALNTLAREETLALHVVELDVSECASVDQAIAEILKQTPKIDVLVNNAGYAIMGVSEAISVEQMQAQFNTNVFGIQRMMRAVLPAMRAQQDGLVINISSVVGQVTFPFSGIYGATKHAVEAMTESYHYELSQLGVDVVLIQPSAYPTSIFDKVPGPADQERLAQYGEIATMANNMMNGIAASMTGENPPNPHEVVEAIARLINTPKGQRPVRTLVGYGYGAEVLNGQITTVQQQMIESMGMGHLSQVKTAALV